MFKKIMFTGILLITISVLNAKSIEASRAFDSEVISCSTEAELISRIAADNYFKNYYISNVEFANKVIETKAGTLFLKYIQKAITPNEQEVLFAKMNVNSKKEFEAIAANLKNEAVSFFNKFPELKLLTEKGQKQLLVNAFKKVSTDNSIATKFANAKIITMEQCFWMWMGCNTLCFIGCTYSQNNECYWQCSAFCAGEYGLCWVTAE